MSEPTVPGEEGPGSDAGPAPDSFTARLAETRARAQEALEAARGRHRVVDAASSVLLRPRLVADTVLAGYLALRLFILLFPLAYTVVAGLGLYTRQANGSPEEVASEAGLAPAVSASIVEAAQSSSRNHWFALVVGTFGSLWAARGVLRALNGMHSLTWGLPVPKSGLKPLGPLVTALGVVALVLTGSLTERMRSGDVGLWLANLVALIVMSAIWLLASWWLPHAPVHWWELLPGAVLFGVGIQVLQLATAVYFAPKATTASAAYGVLGIGLVLLSWLVVLGWVVILAADLNAGLHQWWHGTDRSPAPVAEEAEEEVST